MESRAALAYRQTGILLRVGDNVAVNIPMKVGNVSESVEVHANAGLVQTQQNTISQVVDQQRIVDLPLNGRDPTQLITISGASVNHSDGTNTGSKSFFSSQSISIAGSAGDATNYLLDGGDNNDSFTNVNMPFPFPDALAEFSVETSTLPARNGLHPGGVVNAVTKSGTNSWHGDLFEFIRNGDANAINYFAPRQDSLKRNQFGGTLGGRIIRDKLFFFGGEQKLVAPGAPGLSAHRARCSAKRAARKRSSEFGSRKVTGDRCLCGASLGRMLGFHDSDQRAAPPTVREFVAYYNRGCPSALN